MSTTNLRLKSCVCAILAASALSGVAIAQEKTTTLEEIVVTAQKRSQSVQDVPISISVFSDKTRELIGVKTVQDITNFTPGVTYQTSLDRMMVRGVGRLTNNLATDPGVATYVNGVYNSSNWSGGLEPIFIDRIEFLKGPQGTLYGRNSIGGAMNVIGKRPAQDWEGEIRASHENYERNVVEGRVSGPISDGLRFSLGGVSIDQEKGYFHNVNGGPGEGGVAHDDYLEAQIAGNFGSAFDWWGEWTHWDVNRSDRVSAGVNSSHTYDPALYPPGALAPNINYCPTGNVCAVPPVYSGIRNYAAATPDSITDPVDTYMLEAIAHFGFADLKYIGGYTNYRYWAVSDVGGTAALANNSYTPAGATAPLTIAGGSQFHYLEDKHYFSNELNLVSTGDGALQWILGAYQYHEGYDQYFSFTDPLQPQLGNQLLLSPAFAPIGYVANPGNETYRNETWAKANSHAVFGELDWKMASTLKGTLGLRYTRDEKSALEELHAVQFGSATSLPTATTLAQSIGQFIATSQVGGYYGTAAFAGPCAGCFDRNLSDHWGATTGTVGLEWNPVENSLGYIKFTRGYKSGGLNSGGIFTNPYTDAEKINAFEAGWKQDVTQSLQIDASVFFYNYLGAQAPLTVVNPGSTNTTVYVNLDGVHNLGGDVSLTWNATSQLQFLLTYGYLKSTIQAGCCFVDGTDPQAKAPGAQPVGLPNGGSQGQSLAGQSMPGSPRNQGSAVANYRFDFTPGSFTLVGSYSFRSEEYYSIFNRSYNRGGGYGTAGFRGLWIAADNSYSIIGYVNNAFNKIAYDNVSGGLTSNDLAETLTLIPPRTYGLEVQLRFGASAK